MSSIAEALEEIGGPRAISGCQRLFTNLQAILDEQQAGLHGEPNMGMPASPRPVLKVIEPNFAFEITDGRLGTPRSSSEPNQVAP